MRNLGWKGVPGGLAICLPGRGPCTCAGLIAWLIVLSLAVWLSGCSSIGKGSRSPRGHIDFASIPDAVPRLEPKSRYGNPAHYEVFGQRYHTLDDGRGYRAQGTASWYGPDFHGKRTSSGDVYDMYTMTAAHKSLPLPTYARVTNLENGRSIVVRVNDRGPFHDDRVIDLSYVAAGKLGMLERGTASVEVRAIDPTQPEQASPFRVAQTPSEQVRLPESQAVMPPSTLHVQSHYVQVGAFGNRDNAERLKDQLAGAIPHQVRIRPSEVASPAYYRVQVGPLPDRELAETVSERLAALGVNNTRLIVE